MNEFKFNKLIRNLSSDESAFVELYNFYFPRIKTFIGYQYKDEQFGEDIAQEFFIKINKLNITQWIKYPTSWVMKVCDNLAKTFIRKIPEVLPYNDEVVAAIETTNLDDLKNGGISEENIAALKELDNVTIKIFVMYYWEGFKLKEIAQILGMEYDTVKRKHSRGLKKLKKILLSGPFLILLVSLIC